MRNLMKSKEKSKKTKLFNEEELHFEKFHSLMLESWKMDKRFKLVCQMLIIKTFSNLRTRSFCTIEMESSTSQEVSVDLITRIFQKEFSWQIKSSAQHVALHITLKMGLLRKGLQWETFQPSRFKFEPKRFRLLYRLTFLLLLNENWLNWLI